MAAKIFNLVILNRIRTEIDPILRTNQNGSRNNISTSRQILIYRTLEGVKSKSLPITLIFIDFIKAFDLINRNKKEFILRKYGITTEIINAIMMLYRKTRSMVRSPDGGTTLFEITTGVLQGDTLSPVHSIAVRYTITLALWLGYLMEIQRYSR